MSILPEMRPTLIVMVKEPRAGRVKTRLGREIGMTAAAWWYRHQLKRLLCRLDNPRWTMVLAVAPDHAVHAKFWPEKCTLIAQGQGDLGVRMVRQLRGFGPGPVVLIGSDVPGVQRHHIWSALQCLQRAEIVFGPAPDGGYWLVGTKGRGAKSRQFLRNVRWSTKYALKDSIATCTERVALTETLRDVDTATDLDAVTDSA